MSSFERYYQDLLEWEGIPFKPLIAQWADGDARLIADDISQAVDRSDLKSLVVPVRAGSTNQSMGNQVEEFFIATTKALLQHFRIYKCSGQGYPDRQLCERTGQRKFAFELKATSQWNPTDSNRRVLTSSSQKLRDAFTAPINHLLATLCYNEETGGRRILNVRLDFIQPTTEVSVRLEASVNHKILSSGRHPHRLI